MEPSPCARSERLRVLTAPGQYWLNTPAADTAACRNDDPYVRLQHVGPTACAPGAAVDVESELRRLNYRASMCAAKQFQPGSYTPTSYCDTRRGGACMPFTEPTRVSNPACTAREQGVNRWEWLCYDPQATALMRFEANVPSARVFKDNFVPCLETPQDQSPLLPPGAAYAAGGPSKSDLASEWSPSKGFNAAAPGAQAAGGAVPSCKSLRAMGAA